MLDNYPPYLAFRMATRATIYRLSVAALRAIVPVFAATGKVKYEWVRATHIVDLTWMTDGCLKALHLLNVASLSGNQYTNSAFFEFQENVNRHTKQRLGRIIPEFTAKVAPIRASEQEASRQVGETLSGLTAKRDAERVIVNNWTSAAEKVTPLLL